ncbi:MAG: TRAP transporter small permease [Bacillota bacterium]|nr:TRAP transporter small permease [Bacillota bacterium]
MLIIITNVIIRIPWKPLPGSVEIVEMCGAILLATAIAYTAMMKGHITVGVLVERFPPRIQAAVDLFTNCITLLFTSMLAWETFVFATRMSQRGYSTPNLLIPIAPSVFLVAFSFTMLALVLLLNLTKAAIIVIRGSQDR